MTRRTVAFMAASFGFLAGVVAVALVEVLAESERLHHS